MKKVIESPLTKVLTKEDIALASVKIPQMAELTKLLWEKLKTDDGMMQYLWSSTRGRKENALFSQIARKQIELWFLEPKTIEDVQDVMKKNDAILVVKVYKEPYKILGCDADEENKYYIFESPVIVDDTIVNEKRPFENIVDFDMNYVLGAYGKLFPIQRVRWNESIIEESLKLKHNSELFEQLDGKTIELQQHQADNSVITIKWTFKRGWSRIHTYKWLKSEENSENNRGIDHGLWEWTKQLLLYKHPYLVNYSINGEAKTWKYELEYNSKPYFNFSIKDKG